MPVTAVRSAIARTLLCAGGLSAVTSGCASPDGGPATLPTPAPPLFASHPPRPTPRPAAAPVSDGSPVRTVAFQAAAPPAAAEPAPAGLDDFVRLAVDRNPRLARASLVFIGL